MKIAAALGNGNAFPLTTEQITENACFGWKQSYFTLVSQEMTL